MKLKLFIVPLMLFFPVAFALAQHPQATREVPGTPGLALKSNVLYDLTGTFNLGFEIKTGRKTTLDVSANYNPWTFSENRKWKHLLVQPEYRYWIGEPFYGHFIGAHAHYSQFNAGNLPFGGSDYKDYRYEGWFTGAGVSYGYHHMLSKRWSVEAVIGLGYAYIDYDKYECKKCGEKIKSGSTHYLGVTKAAVSLIYILK